VQGAKAFFEQDLGPGEVFGEAALGGIHTRMHLAQAITNVEVVVIDDQDFMAAQVCCLFCTCFVRLMIVPLTCCCVYCCHQDKDSAHMGTEERQRFLAAVPMFKNWDAYKLLRLAHALIQEEVNKGVVLTHHGKPSKDLYFVVNGMLNIVSSLDKRYVITPLHKHDYIGESCIINRFIKASASKLHEEFYCVAVTKVEVLILPDSAFTLFDLHSVDLIRSTFLAKMEWRRQRVRAMKYERAKMRKHLHFMGKECEALHRLPVDTEYLSEEQVKMIEETHTRTLLATTGGRSSRPSSPGPVERPGSPARDGLPTIGQGRPSSPQQSSLFATGAGTTSRPKSAAPTPSTAAHGHGTVGVDATAPVPEKLSDIEDIPTIFIKDMDRFMVAITCRTERERAKFASTVSNALRPKSARAREFAGKQFWDFG
jgi:CRP-like cAMP-binding protein